MQVIVENGGLLTTVQDLGRRGYERYGVPVSGAMDAPALESANLLVGNNPGEAGLEITLLGPTLRFEASAVLAVTGADLGLQCNGQDVSTGRAFSVRPGDVVSFTGPRSGCRAYLAFAGGLALEEVLGSRSTTARFSIGGYQGRRLQKGDVLPLRRSVETLPGMQRRVLAQEPPEPGVRIVRVLMGPQDDRFTQAGLDTFLHETYTVSAESDRMGYRLDGPVIEHKTDGNIISDGIVTGSIQVPSDGKPIVMLADHQTVGGYTKIATVITVDLPILAQCKADDRIRFAAVDPDTAQRELIARRKRLRALWERLAAPSAKQYRIHVGAQTFDVEIEQWEESSCTTKST